jgi:hypothetical protein
MILTHYADVRYAARVATQEAKLAEQAIDDGDEEVSEGVPRWKKDYSEHAMHAQTLLDICICALSAASSLLLHNSDVSSIHPSPNRLIQRRC